MLLPLGHLSDYSFHVMTHSSVLDAKNNLLMEFFATVNSQRSFSRKIFQLCRRFCSSPELCLSWTAQLRHTGARGDPP